jgi:hypothetical protein
VNLLNILKGEPATPHENCTCCRHWRVFEHDKLDEKARDARSDAHAKGLPIALLPAARGAVGD